MEDEDIIQVWGAGHDILFVDGRVEYFLYHNRSVNTLVDDGLACEHIIVETPGNILEETVKGETIREKLRKAEETGSIKYIY